MSSWMQPQPPRCVGRTPDVSESHWVHDARHTQSQRVAFVPEGVLVEVSGSLRGVFSAPEARRLAQQLVSAANAWERGQP